MHFKVTFDDKYTASRYRKLKRGFVIQDEYISKRIFYEHSILRIYYYTYYEYINVSYTNYKE